MSLYRTAAYLAEIDNQAQDPFDTIVNQTKEVQGITEELKAENPMEWIRQMNSMVNMAKEFLLREIVYVLYKEKVENNYIRTLVL